MVMVVKAEDDFISREEFQVCVATARKIFDSYFWNFVSLLSSSFNVCLRFICHCGHVVQSDVFSCAHACSFVHQRIGGGGAPKPGSDPGSGLEMIRGRRAQHPLRRSDLIFNFLKEKEAQNEQDSHQIQILMQENLSDESKSRLQFVEHTNSFHLSTGNLPNPFTDQHLRLVAEANLCKVDDSILNEKDSQNFALNPILLCQRTCATTATTVLRLWTRQSTNFWSSIRLSRVATCEIHANSRQRFNVFWLVLSAKQTYPEILIGRVLFTWAVSRWRSHGT